MQCRMYQQAINDINKAIEMEPKNVEYWVEKRKRTFAGKPAGRNGKSLEQSY